jgi:hypothetical protein
MTESDHLARYRKDLLYDFIQSKCLYITSWHFLVQTHDFELEI